MNFRSQQLARRREQQVAEITHQRMQLAQNFQLLHWPLNTLDRIGDIGRYLRDRFSFVLLAVTVATALAAKGRLPGKLWRAVQWSRKVSRWLSLWKIAGVMLPRLRRLW